VELTLLRRTFAVCRLEPSWEIPEWARKGPFFSVTRTPDELSLVCPQEDVPPGIRCERGWRAFRLVGPIPFSAVGVLASLVQPLARAGISLFAVSTFDTDYILVRVPDARRASLALRREGHRIHAEPRSSRAPSA
jgi:uncharacterized protein